MASKTFNIYEKYLRYGETQIYIVFHSETSEPYYNASEVCKMMKYENYYKALKNNLQKTDIFRLKNIVKNYKSLYKNAQGNTKFLNESGFLKLIVKGDKKIFDDVFDWITRDVLPALRNFGEYKANSELKMQIDKMNELLKEKEEQVKILEHNMKKTKHKKGGVVYIMRPITVTIDLNADEEIYIKWGKSKDMNDRESTYNTCNPNKIQVIKKIYVDDPKNIENCVAKKMDNYRIKDKKEYFKCSYNQMIATVASCVLYFEDKTIDIAPDISLSRINKYYAFDKDKSVVIKFLNDDANINICDSDIDSSAESDSESLGSDVDTDTDTDSNMAGGYKDNYYCKYLIVNKKYLQLKFDIM